MSAPSRSTSTRTKLIGALLGASLLIPAGSAASVAWASASKPLRVDGYGSWSETYGNWEAVRKTNTSTSKTIRSYASTAFYRYFDADDHTTYVALNTSVPSRDTGSAHSSHDNSYRAGTWFAFRTRPSVTLEIDPRFRGTLTVNAGIRTCLDIPFRPDSCSSTKYLSKYVVF